MKHRVYRILTFHQVPKEDGILQLEAYSGHKIPGKKMHVGMTYIPHPDLNCIHQCTAEPEKMYLCRDWKFIHHDQNHAPQVIGVRVVKEVFLDKEDVVLSFQIGRDPHNRRQRERLGFAKEQMQCSVEQDNFRKVYVVDSRNPQQPRPEEYWRCKPVRLLHESEDGKFQLISVQPLSLESHNTESIGA